MERDIYESLSPIDYRYWDASVAKVLSEGAFIEYKLAVELALVTALRDAGICDDAVLEEVRAATRLVTADDVYAEEKRIGHDIRALVNCLQQKVSDRARPYVHMTATSYDIIDTANARRFADATDNLLVPVLRELMGVLIELTLREADTVQIGRTHGQHAVPITVGFMLSGYVSRLGDCMQSLKRRSLALTGKFSGAVGAHNSSALFVDDPVGFEELVLAALDLKPAEHSTQIAPPEPLLRLLSEVVTVAGVLANVARDMRNLQRTEIAEVGEEFQRDQVGSSTMPQKRNPINFENIESMWKVVLGRMSTVYLDQVSEHQRDLTNSASARTYSEIFAYVVSMAKRLTKTMAKLAVNRESLKRNFDLQGGLIAAEPLYLVLASFGHPSAHEAVRQLTLRAQQSGESFWSFVAKDVDLKVYLERMSGAQRRIIAEPAHYTGVAAEKARAIATRWKNRLQL